MNKQSKKLWYSQAQAWSYQSTPLKPCDEDLKCYLEAVRYLDSDGLINKNVAIMGVTPELFFLLNSIGFNVFAVDDNPEMANRVWPGNTSHVFIHPWQSISNLKLNLKFLLCDGGLHLMSYSDQLEMFRSVDSSIDPEAGLIMRLFLPPPEELCLDSNQILKDFELRKFSLSYLKVRCWHATDLNVSGKVFLKDIWDRLEIWSKGDLYGRLLDMGYLSDEISTLTPYRKNEICYCFLTLEKINLILQKMTRLHLKKIFYPEYHLGSQFPVVVLKRV